MSTYEGSFDEETPSTLPDASSVTASGDSAGSSGEAASVPTSSDASEMAAVPTREAPRTAGGPSSPSTATAPAPVTLAMLPTAVPVPVPRPVATLRSASVSRSSASTAASKPSGDGEGGGDEGGATSDNAHVRAALVTGEWTAHKDAASGRTYYFNTRTKETTWDLAAELSRQESSSVNTLTGAAEERHWVATQAADRSRFQQLSEFVAFGSSASTSVARPSMAETTPFTSPAAEPPLKVAELLGGGATRGPDPPPHTGSDSPSSPPAHPHSSKPDSVVDAKAGEGAAGGGGVPGPARRRDSTKTSTTGDPSSVFSTLSQHLRVAPGGAARLEPSLAPPESGRSMGATSAPATGGTTAGPAAATPTVILALPSLPPPSFASPTTATHLLDGLRIASTPPPAPAMALMDSALPPPLPPAAAAAAAAAPQVDPRLVELRETSEAVERLVRAFAVLRGESGPRSLAAFSPDSSAREPLTATTMHKVGATSTVRPVTETRPRAPPLLGPAPPVLSADEKAAIAGNDALVEEVVMGCVLEMLQDDLGKAHYRQRLADRLRAKPPHVTVTADSFRGGSTAPAHEPWGGASGGPVGAARPRAPSRAPFSVFDGELRAFDADGADGAEALYHSVQANLLRYVLSHVVDPTRPQPQRPPAGSPGGGATPTPVTPHFAWILLMDLLAVCTDIVERGFVAGASGGAASIPPTPVIVRYDGERHCELLARNAMHCLPFEVLETTANHDGTEGGPSSDPAARPRSRPLFRMEFWVTRSAMFTVVDALSSTIREHITHTAKTAPYAIFATDVNPYVNARVLAPLATPMFRLVMDRHPRGHEPTAHAEGGLLSGPYRASSARALGEHVRTPSLPVADETEVDAFFGVPPTCLQSIACTLSSIATNLLAQVQKSQQGPTHRRRIEATAASGCPVPDAEAYEDLASAVADAVRELMEDTSVRAAVARRSMDVFEARQKVRRQAYPEKGRLARERTIVERAEREAEELVRRITQEMLVREAGV